MGEAPSSGSLDGSPEPEEETRGNANPSRKCSGRSFGKIFAPQDIPANESEPPPLLLRILIRIVS